MKKKILVAVIVCLMAVTMLYAGDVMESVLRDGTGTGRYCKINTNNQLETKTVVITASCQAAIAGDAYGAFADCTTASTDDDFFYLRNNDERDLVVYRIEAWADDAQQEISILLGGTDAGTDAGDAVVPANLNAASSKTANVDCTDDATDLAVTGGAEAVLLKLHTTALISTVYDVPGGLVLPEGTRLHAAATLDGLINMNVYFYFRPAD